MIRVNAPRLGRAALAVLLAATVAACDDDATGAEEHREAAGLVVVDEATNADLVTVNAARQVTGTLTVPAGGERAVEVYFVDEDGDRFQLDDGDEELRWTVANTAIADFEAHDGHLDMVGKVAGNTTVLFRIWHGGHSDYDSPNIPVTVTP